MGELTIPYFTEQIITYIGNKRSLLSEIESEVVFVKKKIRQEKLVTADLFSGSGIVSRLLKVNSSLVISNDLEYYSKVINECFLSNPSEIDMDQFDKTLVDIESHIKENPIEGIITHNYAPVNDDYINKGERVFYTHENAVYIDSFRHYIDICCPESLKKYFLALLITEASVHVNTSGVFKGFYKDKDSGIGKFGGTASNALQRIKGRISISRPVLSLENTRYKVFQQDAISLSKNLEKTDLVYLDPPYNQHPYGSNYFMLNLILENKLPSEVSNVSGIPKEWNHSTFNKKAEALSSMEEIIKNLDTKFILVSYNNEGFISFTEMESMLKKYGCVSCKEISYNTFRGSRNLHGRNIHTNEFLFLLEKREE